MYYFAEDKDTKEVYRCDLKILSADVASEYKCTTERAIELLNLTNIENPLHLTTCVVWAEHD